MDGDGGRKGAQEQGAQNSWKEREGCWGGLRARSTMPLVVWMTRMLLLGSANITTKLEGNDERGVYMKQSYPYLPV